MGTKEQQNHLANLINKTNHQLASVVYELDNFELTEEELDEELNAAIKTCDLLVTTLGLLLDPITQQPY